MKNEGIKGKIYESEFILGIQDMIRKRILNSPILENQTGDGYKEDQSFGVKTPKYVKQTSLWYTEDKISDQEFIKSIQNLIKNGRIVI